MPNRKGHPLFVGTLSIRRHFLNDELLRFLRPAFTFLRFMGVEVAHTGNRRLFLRLLNLLFLVVDVCVCFVVLSVVLTHPNFNKGGTMTVNWTVFITFTNEVLFKVSSHFYLLNLVAGSKLTQLWSVIQQLSFPGLKIRQLSRTALSIYFLEYFISTAFVALRGYGQYDSVWSELLFLLSQFCFIFSMNALLLYLIIGLLAIELFRQMRLDVKNTVALFPHSLSSNQVELDERVGKWKLRYVLLTQLIDQINQCFGLVLLLSITFFYISIVNSSFYVFLSLKHGYYIPCANYLFNISKNTVYLLAIAYVPHKVKSEAFNIVKALRKLNFNESEFQFKVNFLMIDIMNFLPNISALGLFSVNLLMLPKLLGTALTHLIILCQFQLTENV